MADPVPGPGEVLIGVRATALNQADLLQMRGLYPPPAGESPTPGLECAGEVVACGVEVERFAVGDRVMALLAGGGHATRAVAPESQVMAIPGALSWTEAAAVPEAGLTSWTNLVFEGRLQRGETVLISGATSGVGTFAIQLARSIGARVLVAGRDRERLEALRDRDFGVTGIVVLGDDLVAQVSRETAGVGVDLVLDLVGGEHFPRHLACLKTRGRLVLVGLMAGAAAAVDLGTILRRRLVVRGSVLRSRSRGEKAGLVAGFVVAAGAALADGSIRPVVDRVLPFDDIARGYREMAAGGLLGKIVLEVGG